MPAPKNLIRTIVRSNHSITFLICSRDLDICISVLVTCCRDKFLVCWSNRCTHAFPKDSDLGHSTCRSCAVTLYCREFIITGSGNDVRVCRACSSEIRSRSEGLHCIFVWVIGCKRLCLALERLKLTLSHYALVLVVCCDVQTLNRNAELTVCSEFCMKFLLITISLCDHKEESKLIYIISTAALECTGECHIVLRLFRCRNIDCKIICLETLLDLVVLGTIEFDVGLIIIVSSEEKTCELNIFRATVELYRLNIIAGHRLRQ